MRRGEENIFRILCKITDFCHVQTPQHHMPMLPHPGLNSVFPLLSCTTYLFFSLSKNTPHLFLKYANYSQTFIPFFRQFFLILLIRSHCTYLPADLKTYLKVTSLNLSLMPFGTTNLTHALCFPKLSIITSILN